MEYFENKSPNFEALIDFWYGCNATAAPPVVNPPPIVIPPIVVPPIVVPPIGTPPSNVNFNIGF
jgi:hypothetical protein